MDYDKAITDVEKLLEEEATNAPSPETPPEDAPGAAQSEVLEFNDTLPELPIMPDESVKDFEGFKYGLLEDLVPNCAIAEILADNIIANEWEIYRLRRWRKTLLVAHAEEHLAKEISNAQLEDETSSKALTLAKSAMREDEEQATVLQLLANLKIDPATSLARAYASFDGSLAYFEQ